MKLVEWFLKANTKQLQEAALAYERSKRPDVPLSADEVRRVALRELDGPDAVLMGYVAATGEPLRVGAAFDNRHEYTGERPGAERPTRFSIDSSNASTAPLIGGIRWKPN